MSDPTNPDINSLGIRQTDQGRVGRRLIRRSRDEEVHLRRFVIDAARLLADLHCEDVLALDVRGMSDVTDYIMIASGTSDRQIRSVADDVEDLAAQFNFDRFGRDVDGPATWLVIDFVDVVVHLFDPATRAFYDLEMMWGDAPQVPWNLTESGD